MLLLHHPSLLGAERDSSGRIFETEKCKGQICDTFSRSNFTDAAEWILCNVDSSQLFLRKQSSLNIIVIIIIIINDNYTTDACARKQWCSFFWGIVLMSKTNSVYSVHGCYWCVHVFLPGLYEYFYIRLESGYFPQNISKILLMRSQSGNEKTLAILFLYGGIKYFLGIECKRCLFLTVEMCAGFKYSKKTSLG